jgi:hypothetical protein
LVAGCPTRRHPNVIRLYGYCLEPPTVCLILELLPGSLQDLLYPKVDGSVQISFRNAPTTGSNVLKSPGASTVTESLDHLTGNVGSLLSSGSAAQQPQALPSLQEQPSPVTSSSASPAPQAQQGAEAAVGGSESPELETPAEATVVSPAAAEGYEFPISKSPLSMQQVLDISMQVAAGLAYLHATPEVPELEVAGEASGASLEQLTPVPPPPNPPSSAQPHKDKRIVHRGEGGHVAQLACSRAVFMA